METPRSPRLRRPWSAHPVAVDCASVALIAVAQIAIFRQLAHLRGVSHWEGAVIFAVAHDTYVRGGWPLLTGLLKQEGGVVLDVKSQLNRGARPARVELWRL